MDWTQLETSTLLDILNKKSSFPGSFISIPEIQAQNKVLKHCGLPDDEYLVLLKHWVSEAHRNYWRVLLDASALVLGKGRLYLGLHRPDFLVCCLDNTHSNPSRITCLLVRTKSFDTSTASSQVNGWVRMSTCLIFSDKIWTAIPKLVSWTLSLTVNFPGILCRMNKTYNKFKRKALITGLVVISMYVFKIPDHLDGSCLLVDTVVHVWFLWPNHFSITVNLF